MAVRNRMRETRRARGLTQAQLAGRADVSRQTVCEIEANPRYSTTGQIMARLADALGVNLGDLFWSEHGPDGVA